jgi:hypothetical protein
MDEHDPREVEEAFRHLWRVRPVGEDWVAQSALYATRPSTSTTTTAGAAGRAYRDAATRFDPDHPRKRSRQHWPATPDWAHP